MKLKLTLLSALAAMTVSSSAQTEEVPAQVANIQVDASLIRSEQNPWFYGGNNIYPGGAQGLMDPKTKEFDQPTLQLSAVLGLRT